jgi:glycosyltransferase involved in cell wall biosynthesis
VTTAPITVCIGTFGNEQIWSALAHDRAMASVDRQTLPPENLIWCHGPDLHSARNQAAARVRSDWLCFLDADDELDAHYLEAMTRAVTDLGVADWLLQPATLGVHPDGHEDPFPVLIPPKPLLDGNFLVIGTLVRRAQFDRLGGFCDFPLYEDWDLWLRCFLDGASISQVPAAIYRVFVNEAGRNSADRATQLRVYHQIRSRHLVR